MKKINLLQKITARLRMARPQPKEAEVLPSAQEVSSQDKGENALWRSEEFFRLITEYSLDITLIVDNKGVIKYASHSIERFLGYKPEELIGKSGFELIHNTDLPRAIYDFGKAIVTREVVIPNSFRVRHKDGSLRILEGVGKNCLDNPVLAGFLMDVRDVTERGRQRRNCGILKNVLRCYLNMPRMPFI